MLLREKHLFLVVSRLKPLFPSLSKLYIQSSAEIALSSPPHSTSLLVYIALLLDAVTAEASAVFLIRAGSAVYRNCACSLPSQGISSMVTIIKGTSYDSWDAPLYPPGPCRELQVNVSPGKCYSFNPNWLSTLGLEESIWQRA